MKKQLIVLPLVLGLALFAGCNKNDTPAADSASAPTPATPQIAGSPPFDGGRKTSFQEVTSQLDPGGSLYLYLATDQWLKGLSQKVSDLKGVVAGIGRPAPQEAEQIERGFNLISSLIQRCGVEDITGVGVSAAPVAPGLYRNKLIIHHAAGTGQ